jgi:hypothetical protein
MPGETPDLSERCIGWGVPGERNNGDVTEIVDTDEIHQPTRRPEFSCPLPRIPPAIRSIMPMASSHQVGGERDPTQGAGRRST